MSDIWKGREVMCNLAEIEGFDDATGFLLARVDGPPSDFYFRPPEAEHDGSPHTDDDYATRRDCQRCRYILGWNDGASK